MAKKKIVLYITNDVIKICEAVQSGSNVLVNRVFQVRTPDGSVDDGLILEVDRVAAAVRDAFRENGIRKAKLAFTIYSRKIATKEIELPYVKQVNRINDMILSNIDDYFPMNNMEDYLIRYQVLDQVVSEGRKFNKIAVFAVQKEMVASYYALGKELRLPVLTVDYQINSLNNLMKKQVKNGISLVLQMDSDTTHVTIMNAQAQLFRRSIPHGSDSLIQSFAADNRLDEEEARMILQDTRMMEENLTPEEYGELVGDFASAITRVVEFYTSKNPDLMIEHAKLYGEGVALADVGNVLGRTLGVEIETLFQLNGVQVKKKNPQGLTADQLNAYLPNIGAMMGTLDLRIDGEGKRNKGGGYAPMFILLGITVVASASISIFLGYEKRVLEYEKVYLETAISQLEDAEDIFNAYEDAKEYIDTLASHTVSTLNSNEALHAFIMDLEAIMPEGMGFNSLSAQNGEISITGQTAGKESIALFIMALKELPYASNVRVDSIRDTYDEVGAVTSDFNLILKISIEGIVKDTPTIELPEGHPIYLALDAGVTAIWEEGSTPPDNVAPIGGEQAATEGGEE